MPKRKLRTTMTWSKRVSSVRRMARANGCCGDDARLTTRTPPGARRFSAKAKTGGRQVERHRQSDVGVGDDDVPGLLAIDQKAPRVGQRHRKSRVGAEEEVPLRDVEHRRVDLDDVDGRLGKRAVR